MAQRARDLVLKTAAAQHEAAVGGKPDLLEGLLVEPGAAERAVGLAARRGLARECQVALMR